VAYTVEEQNWLRRDFSIFEALPKSVRQALRDCPRKIDVYELKRRAKNTSEMLALIKSGEAPV
jgi:hypothetical protein